MKLPLPFLVVITGSALMLASCMTPSQPLQPGVDVEEIKRQAPVTPTPNVGQHEAGRNAVDYSNPRGPYNRSGYGDRYGSGDGYRRY